MAVWNTHITTFQSNFKHSQPTHETYAKSQDLSTAISQRYPWMLNNPFCMSSFGMIDHKLSQCKAFLYIYGWIKWHRQLKVSKYFKDYVKLRSALSIIPKSNNV